MVPYIEVASKDIRITSQITSFPLADLCIGMRAEWHMINGGKSWVAAWVAWNRLPPNFFPLSVSTLRRALVWYAGF